MVAFFEPYLAEDDRVREVSVEELNQMANVINKMIAERGGTDYCYYVTESSRYAGYGDHAMSKISEKIDTGTIQENGTVMW